MRLIRIFAYGSNHCSREQCTCGVGLAASYATMCVLTSTLAHKPAFDQSATHKSALGCSPVYGSQQQGRPSCCSTRLSAVLYSACGLISSNLTIDHSQALRDSQLALHCMRYLHTIPTFKTSSNAQYVTLSSSAC